MSGEPSAPNLEHLGRHSVRELHGRPRLDFAELEHVKPTQRAGIHNDLGRIRGWRQLGHSAILHQQQRRINSSSHEECGDDQQCDALSAERLGHFVLCSKDVCKQTAERLAYVFWSRVTAQDSAS